MAHLRAVRAAVAAVGCEVDRGVVSADTWVAVAQKAAALSCAGVLDDKDKIMARATLAAAMVQKKGPVGHASAAALKELDSELRANSFLGSPHSATCCDAVVYAAIRSSCFDGDTLSTYPSLSRWFSYMTDLTSEDILRNIDIITGLNRNTKDTITSDNAEPAPSIPSVSRVAATSTATVEKEKAKPRGKGKPEAADAATAAVAVDPNALDIRVGRIEHISKHADADSLYVEKINLGEADGSRTIVSGLVKHVPIAEMQNRMVLVLCNLKPAKMRGVMSQGMVLCSTDPESGRAVPIVPPVGSECGDRAVFGSLTNERAVYTEIDPKKKTNLWSPIQPQLRTNELKVAGFSDPATNEFVELATVHGKVVSDDFANAPIS